MDSTGKPCTVEEGVIEYDMDDSQPTSRPHSPVPSTSLSSSSSRSPSPIGEYVLSKPTPKIQKDDFQVSTPVNRQKKQVVQDEYDEDHYTLARTENQVDVARSDLEIIPTENLEKNSSDSSEKGDRSFLLSKKTLIICFVSILVIISVGGGVTAYFLINQKDTIGTATTSSIERKTTNTEYCTSYGEQDTFTVAFLNLDNYPIDIITYDKDGNEKPVTSRLNPGDVDTHETHFTQDWLFKRSDTRQRLKAYANGVSSETFVGCRFKATKGRLLRVNISSDAVEREITTKITTKLTTTTIATTSTSTTLEVLRNEPLPRSCRFNSVLKSGQTVNSCSEFQEELNQFVNQTVRQYSIDPSQEKEIQKQLYASFCNQKFAGNSMVDCSRDTPGQMRDYCKLTCLDIPEAHQSCFNCYGCLYQDGNCFIYSGTGFSLALQIGSCITNRGTDCSVFGQAPRPISTSAPEKESFPSSCGILGPTGIPITTCDEFHELLLTLMREAGIGAEAKNEFMRTYCNIPWNNPDPKLCTSPTPGLIRNTCSEMCRNV